MATNAVPFAVPPQLISFRTPRRSFTILNSGQKPKYPMFIGNILTIPPVNELQYGRDEKNEPLLLSDTDADGDPIPGSRVIEDIYVTLEDMEEVLVFDAVRACVHILGLQPGSDGKATLAAGPYALAGLSLLPRHAPKSQWKAIAADGEKRAYVARVEAARQYLKAVDETNAIRKKNGLDPTVPDMLEYEQNKALIDNYNALVRTQTKLSPHQEDQVNEDLEFEAFAKAKVLELATKAAEGRAIDKAVLAAELLQDPTVLARLRQMKYRIRKVGEMARSTVDLQKAAADQAKRDLENEIGGGSGNVDGAGEGEDKD